MSSVPVEMRVIYLLMLKPHNMIYENHVWLKDYEATMMLRRAGHIWGNLMKVKAMLWELNREENMKNNRMFGSMDWKF